EGIESTFALNYLSRFALTQRLLPLLESAGRSNQSARVVLLSGAAQQGKIYFDDVNLTGNFSTIRSVLQFCAANDAFTSEMARIRNGEQSNVAINCLKIGVVKTKIRREFPLWMKILVPIIFDPLLRQTPRDVAGSVLSLLLDNQFEGVSGGLFLKIKRFKRIEPGSAATDSETGRRLFELSERMVAKAIGSVPLAYG
ncbi:MAG TPA: hypothetical protein VL361_29875, partial [Candidatus Limnocylindrales bacterium]|nr:hypothetical protein [Candidatus Limnocylindrales bacterium]